MKKVVLKNCEKVYYISWGFWIYGFYLFVFILLFFKLIYFVGGFFYDIV